MIRVLIVDDEPMLASTLQRLLSATYDTDVAPTGTLALQLFLARPHDVVLCDLSVAGLSGVALLEAIHRASPGLERRLVFMTGGEPSPHERAILARHGCVVLEKPFSPAELLDAVRKILA